MLHIREHANNYMNLPSVNFLSSSFFQVCSHSLTDFYQKVFVCLLRLRHHHLFHHLSNFGSVNLSEKVNEVVSFLDLS